LINLAFMSEKIKKASGFIKQGLSRVKKFFLNLSWPKRLILFLVMAGLSILSWRFLGQTRKVETSYETAIVQKGTLVKTVSTSGTITSGNYTNISTKTSGTISKVYVTGGETVYKGQKIAEIVLDDYAKERQASAWVAYLGAKESYLEALNAKDLADIAMWQAHQDRLDAKEAFEDMPEDNINPDTDEEYTESERAIITKTVDQTEKAFRVAEAKYLNADDDIANAQAKVSAALRDYQENSVTILAPAAGVISDLALAENNLVSASATTSSTSGATIVSAQTVGKINHAKGQLIATVDLTEIDVIEVKANQKVSLTLDAYSDKTFSGKILSINTSGSSSSGVTSYPATILLDPVSVEIYPNMAVSAEIITSVKTDVLLVPLTAIQSVGDRTTVQVMRDGQPEAVSVEVGDSNDTQTEIISGLAEGDEVIVLTIISDRVDSQDETSSFGSFGGGSVFIRSGQSGGNMPAGRPAGGF
jgi:multidrug efflux pump subunit AcrA (membrane-fusion protein)